MSQIAQKHLLAGFIFGDRENNEYIYLPGGEVGTEHPPGKISPWRKQAISSVI